VNVASTIVEVPRSILAALAVELDVLRFSRAERSGALGFRDRLYLEGLNLDINDRHGALRY
jgi:hypothetical protein